MAIESSNTIISAIISWFSDWSTLILAVTAFTAPFAFSFWWRMYTRPKIHIIFDNKPPYCHFTGGHPPMYYCRFVVINTGRTQADDCEAVLESVWQIEKQSDGRKGERKWERFLPVNLKWTGEDPVKDFERACFKTIYPGKRNYFCDVGHIDKGERLVEGKIPFMFEQTMGFLGQSDGVTPGQYKLEISVYSKNAAKKTQRFGVRWSGEWKTTNEEMAREIVVSK